MNKEIVKFSATEADIAKKKAIYMDLTVGGPEDDEGFQAVDTARKVMKADRVSINNREKELKEDANKWRKKVGERAKELRALIEPIENHLIEQCKIVTDEKKRIKEEETRLFKEKIDSRHWQLTSIGVSIPYQDVSFMSDEEFETRLSLELDAQKAERKRLEEAKKIEDERIAEEKRLETERVAKVAAEQEAERVRLADERKRQEDALAMVKVEQDRVSAELAARQAEIDKKEEVVQDEKDRLERIEFEKKAKESAKIQADIDAKAAAEKAEAEKKEKERAEAAEVKRIAALRPDSTKAFDWLSLCGDSIPDVDIGTKLIADILYHAASEISVILNSAHEKVKELTNPHDTITGGQDSDETENILDDGEEWFHDPDMGARG